MKRVYILFCFCLFLGSIVQADNCNKNCNFCISPSLRYRVGDGLSYKRGYQTAELCLGFKQCCLIPFVDAQIHHIEKNCAFQVRNSIRNRDWRNESWAASLGFGFRELVNNGCQTFGIYGFYDIRYLARQRLEQWSAGFELLGYPLDLRANVYLPFGKRQVVESTRNFDFPGGFVAREIDYQEALWRFDMEVGRCFFRQCSCLNVYAAAGPYFFGSTFNGCNGGRMHLGGMARVATCLCNFLELGLYVTHDPIYRTNVQAEISLSFRFPRSMRGCPCCCRIYRNEIIMTKRRCVFKTNF